MSNEAQDSAPAARTYDTRLGILCIFGGIIALTLMDALIKWVSGTFALHEVTFARSVVAILLTLVIARFVGGLSVLRTRRPGLHLARGLLLVIANFCFFSAIASMPLAEATAIFFLAPVVHHGVVGAHLGREGRNAALARRSGGLGRHDPDAAPGSRFL